MMKSRKVAVVLSIILSAIAIMHPGTAQSQQVPYKTSGTDGQYFPFGDGGQNSAGDYKGIGTGTHVGKLSFAGNVTVEGDLFPEPGIFFLGKFSGSQSHFAANGDRLDMEVLEGDVLLEFDQETGLAFGTWATTGVITGGTGRFANASGIVAIVAINPPFDPMALIAWPFDWSVNGEIDLGKKGKKN